MVKLDQTNDNRMSDFLGIDEPVFDSQSLESTMTPVTEYIESFSILEKSEVFLICFRSLKWFTSVRRYKQVVEYDSKDRRSLENIEISPMQIAHDLYAANNVEQRRKEIRQSMIGFQHFYNPIFYATPGQYSKDTDSVLKDSFRLLAEHGFTPKLFIQKLEEVLVVEYLLPSYFAYLEVNSYVSKNGKVLHSEDNYGALAYGVWKPKFIVENSDLIFGKAQILLRNEH